MFYLRYIVAELRRRRGRTVLTALGLGVGVGLVVAVSALSRGLDDAQSEVLEPLTGVGTDMSVTRPLKLTGPDGGPAAPPGGVLSNSERRSLRRESGGPRFGLRNVAKPGERFTTTDFVTNQLTFPETQVNGVRQLAGASDVAAGLTLTVVDVSGRIPQDAGVQSGAAPAPGGGPSVQVDGPRSVKFDQKTVTGVDAGTPTLAPVVPGQITRGSWFSDDATHQAILSASYARRKSLEVGDTVKLKHTRFEVVGIAKTPLGGQASDVYVKLDQLQKLSDRAGRVNVMYVRAGDADGVSALARQIKQTVPGASVTTSKNLADRVGGSLADAKSLSGKLGTALSIVGLVAAFLIASLLSLSSVTKRIRELGTLKALGWPQRKVVRQVTGESLVQGGLGGLAGAALGIGAAAIVTAVGPTLQASVASAATSTPGRGPGGGPGFFAGPLGFGQGSIASGTQDVTLHAPVDGALIALAIGLALVGGLIAGAAGGLRAARLRPADALRHID